MRKLLLFILVFPFLTQAQTDNYEYRSTENPYYWKNKKPHAAYWQQDVHYKLKAKLDDKENVFDGEESLTYYNNSPDELSFVYFHLYNNAQTKDSYLAELYEKNNYNLKFDKNRSAGLGTYVETVTVNGNMLRTELDNTILKVYLPSPLKPGEAVVIDMKFKTYFSAAEAIRNRMKMFMSKGNNKHYDLVHWYPRISVYDSKFGWDTEQHMDHEFYGDFGQFEVELTLPNQYIVDGTGSMQNEDEVLPTDLRKALDVSNFKSNWEQKPSEVIKPDGTFKTWKFRAVNTHDVAYTMDPTYRIGEVKWNGIRCIALVQESHAAGWQYAANYVAAIIKTNSEKIGMYAYPKMIAADAQDGMEYPMLTLDGGFDPIYRSLFVHEISHNWFFGMLGSNETYRAFMDEGFTQFYSGLTYEAIEGKYEPETPPKNWYLKKFYEPTNILESEVFSGYYAMQMQQDESTLNTHSDGFNSAIRHGGGYGAVYRKTSTMLYNLQYVLGDELFEKAMQNYFNQWKMCHPYPEDFRNSFIQFTHVDLNWFFDQWLETSKTIDYKITKVRKGDNPNEYKITFKRIGKMQMPIDFTVFSKDSVAHNYHIPNNWFIKQTDATVLPKWIGWDKVGETYTATVTAKGGISNVIIDTTNRMADINMVNNRMKKNVNLNFDSKLYKAPDRTAYQMFARPALWYNGYDGFKIGAHVNGSYLNTKNVFDATVFLNTGRVQYNLSDVQKDFANDPMSFVFNYKTTTEKFVKKSSFWANAKMIDGLQAGLIGFDKRSNNDKNRLYFQLKGMLRDMPKDFNYLVYKAEWGLRYFNSSMTIGLDHNYQYKRGTGLININLKTPALYSYYSFSALQFSTINRNNLGKIKINTRLFAQLGTGTIMPNESALYTAGGNPEEMMDNKYTRSQGFFPIDWANFGAKTNHYTFGGGLNLRGYSGYLLPRIDNNGNIVYDYKGSSGASFNTEIEFGQLFKFNPRFLKNAFNLKPYLFGDVGVINTNGHDNNNLAFTKPMVDAGLGFALTIQKWWKLQTVKPLTLRFDMPFFINRLPNLEKNYFQFRWMVGVNRAF